ncbi:MAG: carboxymuconolactone decarboxylase family protein [Candidatus Binatia bacterium]
MTNEIVNALCDFERSSVFSEREKLALRFAERMALHHQSIDDSFFHDLRREFSAAEVIELGMMIGLFIGYGRLLAVLDLETTEEGGS